MGGDVNEEEQVPPWSALGPEIKEWVLLLLESHVAQARERRTADHVKMMEQSAKVKHAVAQMSQGDLVTASTAAGMAAAQAAAQSMLETLSADPFEIALLSAIEHLSEREET